MSDVKKQKIFVDKVLDKTKALKGEKKPIALYKELVYYRFYEVLSNANPIFSSLLSEKKLKKLIVEFMHHGAKTDLIWQLPNEFRTFIKKEKKLEKSMPYIHDLLWFEWIEIKLFMQDYSAFSFSKLNFKNEYKLSKSARIKKLSYKVYERDFENSGEYFVLAYYDMNVQEVRYREISEFMYVFIKNLKNNSLIEVIRKMSKRYSLEHKEIKNILKEPLQELCELGVIIKEKR